MKTFTFVNDDKVVIDGRIFICLDEKKVVNFDQGQWVYYTIPSEIKGHDALFRVGEIIETGDKGRWRVSNLDNKCNWYELSRCRLATKEEIETHLREIADEKYVGKNVRCLLLGSGTANRFSYYHNETDRLVYTSDMGNIVLYEKGKWAEIVPSKKKLPKTKLGIAMLLADFHVPLLVVTKFLEDYEAE